jgi:acetyl/propionyl-CoA carboxylase alpha subunit
VDGPIAVKYVATVGNESCTADVVGGDGRYRVTVGEAQWDVDVGTATPGIYSMLIGGVSYVADVVDRDGICVVEVGGERYEILVEEQTRHIIRTRGRGGAAAGDRTLTAPLPGKISRVAVRPGDAVNAGDILLVIEAMKMENEFRAAGAGTVAEVRVAAGQAVNAGDVLIVMGGGGDGDRA